MRWAVAVVVGVVGVEVVLGQPPTLSKKHVIGNEELGRVTHVAFTGDSKALIAASGFGTASHDLATGKVRAKYEAMKYTPDPVAGLPAGEKLVRGSFAFLEIGSPEDKIFPKVRFKCGGEVNSVAASADGKLVAGLIWKTPSVEVWDVAAGKKVATLTGTKGAPMAGAFAPDGKAFAGVDGTHTVTVWDVKTGKKTATLAGGPGRTGASAGPVGFSTDGKTVYGPGDGATKLVAWDPAAQRKRWETPNPKKAIGSTPAEFDTVAVHPGGKFLVAATTLPDAQWWVFLDAETGAVTGEMKAVGRIGTGGPHFSPDGKWLAAGSFSGVVEVYEVK